MACEIIVPRLGWSMTEGVFIEWRRRDGDRVAPGDALFTIEGDKAVEEVPAMENGILRIAPNGPRPGERVAVGRTIGYLVREGERAPFESPAAPAAAPPATAPAAASLEQSPFGPAGGGRTGGIARRRITPRAARLAARLGVDWTVLRGSGRSGRIRERDVRDAAEASKAP